MDNVEYYSALKKETPTLWTTRMSPEDTEPSETAEGPTRPDPPWIRNLNQAHSWRQKLERRFPGMGGWGAGRKGGTSSVSVKFQSHKADTFQVSAV